MSQRTANLLLLFAGAVWGMGFVAQQTAMEDIGPMQFMTFRFALAAGAVALFARRETRKGGHPRLNEGDRKYVVGIGVMFFIAMALQQVGIGATTVTSAGFLTGLYVVFVPFVVLAFVRESQHWVVWPTAGLALLGIYLLGDGGFSGLTWGDWLILTSALFAAGHLVLLGRTVQRLERPIVVATGQFAVAAILSLAAYLIFISLPVTKALEPLFSLDRLLAAAPQVLYGGLFAGGLAFTLMAIGQRYTKETHAAVLLSSEALFAALFGAWLLGDTLTTRGYAGAALIFVTILIVQAVPLLGGKSNHEIPGPVTPSRE
jgi:drug/metabolite transporter (DMT)-like permease